MNAFILDGRNKVVEHRRQRVFSKKRLFHHRRYNFQYNNKELLGSTNRFLRWRAGDTLSYYRSNIDDDGNNMINIHQQNNNCTLPERSKTKNDNDKSNVLEAPNVKKIILFAIPAIGIWLCGPILSLIDTSAVGLLSGTAQQAALNPAITITEDGALLVVGEE